MKRSLMWTLCLCVMFAAGAAVAQDDPSGNPPPAPTRSASLSVFGTLVSASDSSIVINTDDGSQMTLSVDGNSSLPPAMGTGDRVTVYYTAPEQGKYLVTRVTKETAGAPADPSPSSGSTTGDATSSGAAGASTTPSGGSGGGTPAGSHKDLPKTASPLWLAGLAGAGLIGAGLGLKSVARSA